MASPNDSGAPGNRTHLPKVFLSYAHDDQTHVRRVHEFAQLLRIYGIQVVVDRDTEEHPGENFAAWADTQLRMCRWVAVIASPEYRRRVEDGLTGDGEGFGVRYEARRIQSLLYADYEAFSRRLLRIVLPDGSVKNFPDFLDAQVTRHYAIRALDPGDSGMVALLNVLTSKLADGQTQPARPAAGQADPGLVSTPATEGGWRGGQSEVGPGQVVDPTPEPSGPGIRERMVTSLRARLRRAPRVTTGGTAVAVVVMLGLGVSLFYGLRPKEPDSGNPVRLTVGYYETPFAPGLLESYEKTHPGVDVVPVQASSWKEHQQHLESVIAARGGANDVEVVDAVFMDRFAQQGDRFVDLGAGVAPTGLWTEPVRATATTRTKQLVGLPMDVGGMAICYRRGLLERARMPSDPASVQRLFSSWEKYFAAGERFRRAGIEGSHWFDRGVNVLNGVLGTEPGRDGEDPTTFDPARDERVKAAWSMVADAVEGGQSADARGQVLWEKAAVEGDFATVACPAWRVGQLQNAVGKGAAGDWSMVAAPDAGSWSGTFVTVPASGTQTGRAAQLAAWLAAPDQQMINFRALSVFPSAQSLWRSPAVLTQRFPVTGASPVGDIIRRSLENASESPVRVRSGLIANAMEKALDKVEAGTRSPAQAWTTAQGDLDEQARV